MHKTPLGVNLPDCLLQETVNYAVAEVFSVMVQRTATLLSSAEHGESIELNSPHVVGTVGFIGEIKGLIYLYFSTEFAETSSGQMLGMSREELIKCGDGVVNDAIGELTNMTVGVFKNQLADRGMPCRLTIPSIVRGSHFKVEPILSASRRVYRFTVDGHQLTVDLMMQPVA